MIHATAFVPHFPPTRPKVVPLGKRLSLVDDFLRLRHLPHILWLDSAAGDPRLARYSYLTADPIAVERFSIPTDSVWELLRGWQWVVQQPTCDDLPPFQGGIAGLFAYDLATSLEPTIGKHAICDLPTDALCVGIYDWVLCLDHATNQATLVVQGWSADEGERPIQAAQRRAAQVRGWLEQPVSRPIERMSRHSTTAYTEIAATSLAPQFATRFPGVTSNFTSVDFRDAIATIVARIREGDSFQVNLAQRLLVRQTIDSVPLYLRLREANAAPFAGYFDGGPWQVLSSSPERFLRLEHGRVETRPIKGTCPRTGDDRRDAQLAAELLTSEKDRAENVMIVDLMRSDLSRVCADPSVTVTQLCAIEQYAHVQHLVSTVEGRLREGLTAIDLLKATFPGGSISGAPKVRAMQNISELEPTPRGPYCGSLGFMAPGDRADWNILIRTITAAHGWLQAPVGGGITAQSDPAGEEAETWVKAEGLLRALGETASMHRKPPTGAKGVPLGDRSDSG
jgi:para-aminobenzoate synthetase component I